MTKSYIAVYRCRLCGSCFPTGRMLTRKGAMDAAFDNLRRYEYADPMTVHFCQDGSYGIADIQGYKLLREEVDTKQE